MCNLRRYRLPFLLRSGGRLSKATECRRKQLARHGTAQSSARELVFPPQEEPRLQTHAGCQMEPRGNIFWWCLYTEAHGSLISWASSMPRAEAWLLPHPSQTIPFEVRAAGKCQSKARCPSLHISSWLDQLRAELRTVVLSPSGKERGGLKQVPKVSLDTWELCFQTKQKQKKVQKPVQLK